MLIMNKWENPRRSDSAGVNRSQSSTGQKKARGATLLPKLPGMKLSEMKLLVNNVIWLSESAITVTPQP